MGDAMKKTIQVFVLALAPMLAFAPSPGKVRMWRCTPAWIRRPARSLCSRPPKSRWRPSFRTARRNGPSTGNAQVAGVPAYANLVGADVDPATGRLVVTFDILQDVP